MTSAVLTETAVRELRNMGYARICWPERDLVVALADHWLRTQWQPIETAPRDSRRILVGYVDIWGDWRVHEAWWRMPYESAPVRDCWWCYDGDKTLLSADVHSARDRDKKLGATHWRPLPDAPPQEPA